MQIASIGLGAMGFPMARRLVAAGHDVTVFDVDRERIRSFADTGGRVATSPRSACVGAELVVVSLPDEEASSGAVLDRSGGVLSAGGPGTCILNTSTNSLAHTQRLAERAASAGFGYLDAPVSQAAGSVEDGGLLMMVGGETAVVDRFRPILEVLASTLIHMGPVGSGTLAKLLTQYVGYTQLITVTEAVIAAERAGLDRSAFFGALHSSPGRCFMASVLARRESVPVSERKPAGGPLRLVAKDMAGAMEAMNRIGAPAVTGGGAAALYADALSRGEAERSFLDVLDMMRAMPLLSALETRGDG